MFLAIRCGDGADGADADVRGEGAFEDGEGKAFFDFREHEQGGEVLQAVMFDVRRKDRHPLHAADALGFEGGGQAIDPFLGVLVEYLNDLVGVDHVISTVGEHGRFGRFDGQVEIQTPGLQQIFL